MLFGDEHVKRYRETDGAEGHEWQGTQCLILRTKGRKSGEPRDAALIYGRTPDGEAMIVASKGGADQPPAWFLNLEADPEVEVQVLADKYRARARVATPDEKPGLWKTMTKEWPPYDEYQTKTDRQIAIVVLDRV